MRQTGSSQPIDFILSKAGWEVCFAALTSLRSAKMRHYGTLETGNPGFLVRMTLTSLCAQEEKNNKRFARLLLLLFVCLEGICASTCLLASDLCTLGWPLAFKGLAPAAWFAHLFRQALLRWQVGGANHSKATFPGLSDDAAQPWPTPAFRNGRDARCPTYMYAPRNPHTALRSRGNKKGRCVDNKEEKEGP